MPYFFNTEVSAHLRNVSQVFIVSGFIVPQMLRRCDADGPHLRNPSPPSPFRVPTAGHSDGVDDVVAAGMSFPTGGRLTVVMHTGSPGRDEDS